MSRYFTKAARVVTPDPEDGFYDLDEFAQPPTMTVHEQDLETWTGLLDVRGNEIHRTETIRLGIWPQSINGG
ncbi:hypothetical protein [Henriciella pelagia]|uniref:hypothetical protein n=1 Tax=Henriciella pelagia TaxID=1977912 RepID=UPI003512E7A6